MITTVFVFLAGVLLSGLVQLLSLGGSLPAGVDSALNYFAPFWNDWDVVFPLDTLVEIIVLCMTIEAGILLFHLGEWIYHKIPFKFS